METTIVQFNPPLICCFCAKEKTTNCYAYVEGMHYVLLPKCETCVKNKILKPLPEKRNVRRGASDLRLGIGFRLKI
jgi:hypothetical protein